MQPILRDLRIEDRGPLQQMLYKIPSFDHEDQAIAMELISFALETKAQKDYSFIVAVNDNDKSIGYVCFGPTPLTKGSYSLYWIAVDPEYAGRGIGTRLLKAAEENVHANQGRMILIETSSSQNYAATRHFYLKNGYALVETIPDFYRSGEDRVTYLKRFV